MSKEEQAQAQAPKPKTNVLELKKEEATQTPPNVPSEPQQPKLSDNMQIAIYGNHLPGFRSTLAIQRGVEKRLMFKTWGGIGDQICAEPTLRHALKNFKDCEIFLASELPELFTHLKFKRVFDLKEEMYLHHKYLTLETITAPDDSNMVWQFINHLLTNCVDFPSLCALRMQLPIAEREVQMEALPDWKKPEEIKPGPVIVVHPGKHWPSKTFPKDWWDAVLAELIASGVTPILIGADADDNKTTVDVSTEGCLDFRNKHSIKESISFLIKDTDVLLTNDSSTLHMAVAGKAFIGFVATVKHPDLITHYRNGGQWGWRMQNFGKGGMWDLVSTAPNQKDTLEVGEVDEEILRTWLPDPKDFAIWAINKAHEKNCDETKWRQ